MDKAQIRGTAQAETVLPPVSESIAAPVTADEESAVPDAIVLQPDGSIVVTLARPLQALQSGKDDFAAGLQTVKIREMYAGDLIAMDKAEGPQAQALHLTAALTGLPVSVIQRMHYEDAGTLSGIVASKLGKYQAASAKGWAFSQHV